MFLACWQLVSSAQRRVNYTQLHCPAHRRTSSSRKSQQRCRHQRWPWVTCSVHRGASLLLRSDQRAMRRRLVRAWHTAAHMTAGAKRGSLKRNKHDDSESGRRPEVNWWWVTSLRSWNILVLSETIGFPGCSLTVCCSRKEKESTE